MPIDKVHIQNITENKIGQITRTRKLFMETLAVLYLTTSLD